MAVGQPTIALDGTLEVNRQQVPFLDYGKITFNDIKAANAKGNIDPSDGDNYILVTSDGKVKKSSCDNNAGKSITCKWLSKSY